MKGWADLNRVSVYKVKAFAYIEALSLCSQGQEQPHREDPLGTSCPCKGQDSAGLSRTLTVAFTVLGILL